ncbi:MAG: metallophosphoesterase [Paenibacillus sp.]|jgi:predicted MPP superfamily phosphohydrolase|nr:metallophosphoesterase [Paenibacillus sp.]
MKTRTAITIVVVLTLLVIITGYIGWNGFVFWQAAITGQADALYWVLYALLAYSYLLAMLIRRVLPYRVFKALKLIGSYGLAVLMYLLLALPVADIAYVLLRFAGLESDTLITVLGCLIMLLLAGLLIRGRWNAANPIVRRYDIAVGKPAGSRKELRIAVASDLHLGTIVGNKHLGRLIERVRELQPDIVLLPGDVLDDSIEPFIRHNMAEVMSELKAPLGVYVSLGNHEYFGGHIGEYVERMRAIGIRVLVDEVEQVADQFYVAGRKDHAAGQRLGVAELLADTDKSRPIILLDHQPRALGAAADAGVDLMLSGHTHRGQMMPNHLITRRVFELDWGYLRKSAMHTIVSSGFGTWGPPIRLGSRSELLEIRMTFEGEAAR